MVKKIKINVDGYDICYCYTYDDSKKNDNLVVMLHGFGMDKDEKGNFVKLSNRLLDCGMDSIRLDFFGHGESSGDIIDSTIEFDMKVISKILSKYNYSSIYMVGVSYGGGVAFRYACQTNIAKMVLWSPLLDYKRNILYPENHFCREFLGREAVHNIFRDGYSRFGPDGAKFDYRLFLGAFRYPIEDCLRKISSKIKIIHGTSDIVIPYKQSCDIASLFGYSISLIDGGIHCFYDEFSDQVIEETVTFLVND